MKELEIAVGETAKLPNGMIAKVDYVDPKVRRRDNIVLNHTAVLEAEHAAVARNLGIGVKSLEVNPDGSGKVEVDRSSPIVAATHIGEGDFHDRRVVAWHGVPLHTAISMANRQKEKVKKETEEIAREATIEGSLNSSQIESARIDGKLGREVQVAIFNDVGRQIEGHKTRTNETVMIPGEWYQPEESLLVH